MRKYLELETLRELCCERCGSREELEWHHIKYKSQGGGDELSNLEILCKVCHKAEHSQKGDFAEFGQKGGMATFLKYGHSHMSKIGAEGGKAVLAKYSLIHFSLISKGRWTRRCIDDNRKNH